MCIMGNIYFYILLISAVQHSFAKNEKKKLSARSNIKLTEKYLEEEAIRDIENLLINTINEDNNEGESDKVKNHIYEPMSLYKGNEYLKKQVDNLLTRLDIKKRNYRSKNDVKYLRSDNDQQFDDMTPSARYKQFINNLDQNHRDAIKSRSITVVGDTKFDDMFKSDKNNRFEQIMKKLRSNRGSMINNIAIENFDFIDKTLRQRWDYADTKPATHTAILITNDRNSDTNKASEEYLQNQHKLIHKLDNNEIKEGNPVMRAQSIIKMNTNREDIQVSSNNIGMRNEFWKQIDSSVREKRKLPLSLTTVKIDNDQVDDLTQNLDANQKQNSKSIGDTLRFYDIINTENNDEPSQVLKTSDLIHREDIRDQVYPDNNWPELQQKISTNRIEDISVALHRDNWQHNGKKSDIIHRDYLNDLLLPDRNNWKKFEFTKFKGDKEKWLNPDSDWQKLVKRFSINRIGEISDVLHPNGQQKIVRKLDMNFKEDKNNTLHPNNNDDLKFPENPDVYFRADSVDKKIANERTLHKTDSYYNRPISGHPNGQQKSGRRLDINYKDENDSLHPDSNDKWKFLENPDVNSRADSGGKNIPDEKTLYETDSSYTSPQPDGPREEDSPEYHGNRKKRSAFTQAGYTHNPDICQLYNENLIKLWSNLSKYINATEQPNERALHNIALMIEAYLEHQNLKQSTDTAKVKHEGSRDKISEVLLRIKKLLDESEGSSEKITKIITKYIKPFYGDVENRECQQVNEESLGSSVELLFRNYMENNECHNEGERTLRNKKISLRKLPPKIIKSLSSDWHSTNTELKQEIKSILSEDELYKDFHRGKMPRQRPTTKNRRVYKRGRQPHSLSAIYRSGDQNINGSEKLKMRSKVSHKSSNKKLKKSSRKSDLEKNRCEKYAIRKLTVSLRPVIERFMALLECQLDNTLRSLNYDKVSMDPYYLYASKYYSNEDSRREKRVLPRMKITRKHTERSRNISPRKFENVGGYDISNETEKDIFVRGSENGFPWVRKYGLDQTTGMNLPIANSNTDILDSKTNQNNNNNAYITNYNEYFQSPPLYDDYDGIYKTHLSSYPSFINPLISVNKNKNIKEKPINDGNLKNGLFYEDDIPEEPKYIMNVSDQQSDSNVTDESIFNDLTKLRHDDNFVQRESTVKKLESITDFLRKARDESLQTPEFAVPFALDSNKGYVELTHLVKYPKMLVYRPQFIVKNTMPYDDFLKTINNFNMTNDEVRLMKIVRHLPDSSVKVLFETEDFDSPLEVRNIKDYRRSGSEFYPLENTADTVIKNTNYDENTDFTDEASRESLITIYNDEVHSNFMDMLFKPHGYRSGEDELHSASNLNLDSNPENNSTLSNSAPNSTSDLGSSFGLLPSLDSSLVSNIPGLGSSTGEGKVLGSAVGSQIGSGLNTELNSALSLGSTFQLNPIHSSQLSSYLSKLLPPHSNSQSDSNLQQSINSHSQLSAQNSTSNSPSYFTFNTLLSSTTPSSDSSLIGPTTANRNPESDIILPSTTQPPLQWWKWWKNLFKRKIKKIVESMASLADNIDHIIKL